MPTAHSARVSRARDRPLVGDPRRLDGVDMRTSAGRRYRDIVDQLAIEFGVSVNPVALRELAGLRYTLEQTQAAVVAGDARARSDLVRVSNLIARRELSLREAKLALPASTPSSLQDRLTARYAPAVKGGAP
jgi:hypothetical protein